MSTISPSSRPNHLRKLDPRLNQTLRTLRASPVVLCIRHDDPTVALESARAALHGGLQIIEVTFTTPDAPAIIATLREEHPHALIGAGTVLSTDDVAVAARADAAFAMSPVVDPAVVQAAHSHGVLAIPGAATPTEIAHAYHIAGAAVVKVFPIATCGGIDFIRALQGPLGHIPLLPTSGVPTAQLTQFLHQPNVLAVGASHQILAPDALKCADWHAVADNARHWMSLAATCRPSSHSVP